MKFLQRHVEHLKDFVVKQIPRGENRRADTLSKLASTFFDHLSKKVLVEVLREKYKRTVGTHYGAIPAHMDDIDS